MCAGMEDSTSFEVLGKPLIPPSLLAKNTVMNWIMDKGWKVNSRLLRKTIWNSYLNHIRAAVKLGFDAMWVLSGCETLLIDSKTIATINGMYYSLIEDAYGNADYMYRGPAFTSRQAFKEWPYFEKPVDFADKIFTFFKKAVKLYGNDICIIGQAAFGMHESIVGAFGFDKAPIWVRKEKELIRQYVDWIASLELAGSMAMMDAGVKVVLQGDDFAHKTGPTFSPKISEELFGANYRRLTKTVHDRGGRIILHTCGENTLLFDMFMSWGFDGFHAYEPTSNVDIFKEKNLHGDKVTIIGNVGVDYLLTERSKDEEVKAEVKRLIEGLAPGGRYIVAPAHSLNLIPAHKFKVMIDAAHEFGKYTGKEA